MYTYIQYFIHFDDKFSISLLQQGVYSVHVHYLLPTNFRNVGKLSACANSRCHALFSDFSNRPGNVANMYMKMSDTGLAL